MKLNGKEYKVPEVKSFKDVQLLEEKGIKILALSNRTFFDPENLATSVVKGISYLTGLSFEKALDEVDAHLSVEGTFEELLNGIVEDIAVMEKIGALEGFSKGAKAPQDHKKATKSKA